MNNALDRLWPLIESPDPTLPASAVATWPPGIHSQLLAAGFLQQGEDASRVLCPECGEHEDDIVVSNGRFVIPCPRVLRAEVPPVARRQWSANIDGLAMALALTFGLSGQCKELIARRLWRLGRTNWQGASRDLMFARGLGWADAGTTRGEIVRGRKPIVLVPCQRPPDDFWKRRVPPVLALSQFTVLCDGQIEIEPLAITTAIRDADAASSSEQFVTVSEEQLKLMLRQLIKAEAKTELNDDILIAAYRHCGTYRSAAEYLSQQTQQRVTKDAVYRAVQRGGGVLAVFNSDDSGSVVRSVVSQRRDRTGKKLRKSKPLSEE